MLTRLPFPVNPFAINGCFPLALASAALLTMDEMLVMCDIAAGTYRLDRAFVAYKFLFNPGKNTAYCLHADDFWPWCNAATRAGKYVVKPVRRMFRRDLADVVTAWGTTVTSTIPTAARFAREHPVGRFLLFTQYGGHVFACVKGKFSGLAIQPRARVHSAWEITLEDK